MAFDIAYLNHVGGATGKGGGLFTYHSLDTNATMDSAGYFNGGTAYAGAYNLLKVGDIILAVDWATAIGTGTISDFGIFIVNAKASGTLDTTSVVDMLATDAD
jgi:hypothetical protein